MADSDAIVVAIDGPAGAGKSSVARAVAERAGLSLVDTGAIYRAVAWAAFQQSVGLDDAEALADLARKLVIQFGFVRGVNRVHVTVDGQQVDITDSIRTSGVSMAASKVSGHQKVRDALLMLQRRLGEGGAVLEGRDIGTVVFPRAPLKFFLTASAEERARRRALELMERGLAEPYERVLREIQKRDRQDEGRPVAPLKRADDAELVDSTALSAAEVVDRIGTAVEHWRKTRGLSEGDSHVQA